MASTTNKFKLFNDPIYGFISIPSELVFDLVEHPYFQRLRRISQLGLSNLVYPGANHTRFHHALGAMHLMQQAIDVLRSKGHAISDEEAEAVTVGILLHDIGHGPFSHALEHTLVDNVPHEAISKLLMSELNRQFDGRLTLAIEIFEDRHPKKFLHQLISSQLDTDRLDYLKRDAFYTGVVEGAINSERILSMLNVKDNDLVLDDKGITSIEKFLMSRSLMYWQVYMHKAVLSAEFMLVEVLKRAHVLTKQGVELFGGKELQYFLKHRPTLKQFQEDAELLDRFTKLDDYDITGAMKQWMLHDDKVLSQLCARLIDRRLFQIKFLDQRLTAEQRAHLQGEVAQAFDFNDEQAFHFVLEGVASNSTYQANQQEIKILKRNGDIVTLPKASEILPISVYTHEITRPFVCWPKRISWQG